VGHARSEESQLAPSEPPALDEERRKADECCLFEQQDDVKAGRWRPEVLPPREKPSRRCVWLSRRDGKSIPVVDPMFERDDGIDDL
jgi:hypothetical protein